MADLLWPLADMGKSIYLILVAAPLELALAVILVRRKTYREYPFFFVYIVLSICMELVRVSVSHTYLIYFWVYWITEGIYAFFGLFVLDEVFRWFFHPFYGYWSWFAWFFPSVGSLTLAASVWYAAYHPPIQASRIISFVLVFGIAVNIVRLSLFLLFFLLDAIFRLRPWNYAFAIVVGFGISATGALLAYILRSEFGTKFNLLVQYLPPVAYIIAVVLWLAVFTRPEREFTLGPGITPQMVLEEVRRSTRRLGRYREKRR